MMPRYIGLCVVVAVLTAVAAGWVSKQPAFSALAPGLVALGGVVIGLLINRGTEMERRRLENKRAVFMEVCAGISKVQSFLFRHGDFAGEALRLEPEVSGAFYKLDLVADKTTLKAAKEFDDLVDAVLKEIRPKHQAVVSSHRIFQLHENWALQAAEEVVQRVSKVALDPSTPAEMKNVPILFKDLGDKGREAEMDVKKMLEPIRKHLDSIRPDFKKLRGKLLEAMSNELGGNFACED